MIFRDVIIQDILDEFIIDFAKICLLIEIYFLVVFVSQWENVEKILDKCY